MKTLLLFVYIFLFASFTQAQMLLLCDFNYVDTLGVTISDDTVTISNVKLCGYCSAAFAVSVSQSNDSLFIVQTDTAGIIATCQCLFDVDVSITGLPAGIYNAIVYRKYLESYGYPYDTTLYIGSIQFNIPSSTSSNLSFIPNQSECIIVGVDDIDINLPEQYSLSQNFPNPFNTTTTINYDIYKDGYVTMEIFDCLGKEIKILVSESKKQGSYFVEFDASNFASGLYFYQLRVNDFFTTKKMVLLK